MEEEEEEGDYSVRSYILFFFISKDVGAERASFDIAGVGNAITSDNSDDDGFDDGYVDRKEESGVVDHCNNCLGSFDIGRHDNLKIIFN